MINVREFDLVVYTERVGPSNLSLLTSLFND